MTVRKFELTQTFLGTGSFPLFERITMYRQSALCTPSDMLLVPKSDHLKIKQVRRLNIVKMLNVV